MPDPRTPSYKTEQQPAKPIIGKSEKPHGEMEDHTYCEEKSPKDKHKEEVSSPVSEGSLFQHSTVPIGEDYVEEEIESNSTEKHEVGNKSPNL